MFSLVRLGGGRQTAHRDDEASFTQGHGDGSASMQAPLVINDGDISVPPLDFSYFCLAVGCQIREQFIVELFSRCVAIYRRLVIKRGTE